MNGVQWREPPAPPALALGLGTRIGKEEDDDDDIRGTTTKATTSEKVHSCRLQKNMVLGAKFGKKDKLGDYG